MGLSPEGRGFRGQIASAVSRDRLSWQIEAGVRMAHGPQAELPITQVAAPRVLRLDDGSYLMVYGGEIDERYGPRVPNDVTGLLLWATSEDGLAFTVQGLALDTRSQTLEGWGDGPELVRWDDGTVYLYFWSYQGIYHTVRRGDGFDPAPLLALEAERPSPGVLYPPAPPSDPTLGRVGETWYLYHGLGPEEPIFYACCGSTSPASARAAPRPP